jgi:DNA end-binding protein Ku
MKPLWEGAISFGLIHIPVKMYKATDERKPDFHLVREKDLCPIQYMRVCKLTGEEVPFQDIAKSYEYQKGDYVILHDEDFKKAYAKRTETIEVVEFVNNDEINSKYFEQPYYLEPEKGAAKVYALLREALDRSKKVGIATYVLHNLEHLGVLKVENNIIILNQIRFENEFRKPEDLNIPAKENLSKKEIDIAIMLIDRLSEPFKPEKFKDTYTEEIKKVIAEKEKTGKISIKKGGSSKPAEVVDLLSKLKQSLEEAKKLRKNAS